jgi:hypothetical protein
MRSAAEQIVWDVLRQHRYKFQTVRCLAGDWVNGTDFDEHQAKVIVEALRSEGFIGAPHAEPGDGGRLFGRWEN